MTTTMGTTATDLLTAARAAALFTSDLSACAPHSRTEVTTSIRQAIRVHGGSRNCAAELAGEYGDHPETAASRMQWALELIHAFYATHSAPAAQSRPVGRRQSAGTGPALRDPGSRVAGRP